MHCASDWPNAATLVESSFMRLTKLISWVLWCGTLAFVTRADAAQPAARVAGRIVAAQVMGEVIATNLVDDSRRALVNNDVISQRYVVTTGENSRVVLIFSNGAMLNLGAQTTLSIDEFLQDPFREDIALAELKDEPTTSVTKLNLARGELVGDVKHLRREQGSSFTVNTPVGAAGIRGTTFRIVFRPDANGQVIFTLSTSEGAILFEAPASAAVSVETGKEVNVNVEVTVNVATGTVTVVAPPTISAPQDIPAATQAIIATAAQQIIEVSRDAILSTTPAPPPPTETPSPDNPPNDQSNEAEKQAEPPAPEPNREPPFTPPANNAPEITTPPPDVTPGAGAN
jgi:hypothetical protein